MESLGNCYFCFIFFQLFLFARCVFSLISWVFLQGSEIDRKRDSCQSAFLFLLNTQMKLVVLILVL